MELRADLELGVRQQLVMSKQMQQSLEVLQSPVAELAVRIQAAAAENPFLEAALAAAESVSLEHLGGAADPGGHVGADESAGAGESAEVGEPGDTGAGGDLLRPIRAHGRRGGDGPPVRGHVSWREQVLGQFRLQVGDEKQRAIADYLLGCLDARGYLAVSVARVARDLGVPRATVEQVRRRVMRLWPVGLGARDVHECLLVQLEEREQADPVSRRLLRRKLLPLVAQKNFARLAERLGVSEADVRRAVARIRELWPRPLRAVAATTTPAVLPDLTVVKVDGRWEVLPGEEYIPRVRLVPPPAGLACADPDARSFVHGQLSRARWFVGSLDARRRTLTGLMRLIVAEQEGFFAKGPEALKPMGYRYLADRLGLHESTVARAVRGKYVQTPRGMFPLRFFFSKGLPAVVGNGRSPAYLRQRIVELIGEEPSWAPLTDQDLTAALVAEGIVVSRRTVAKYRDQLRIPKASYRRDV